MSSTGRSDQFAVGPEGEARQSSKQLGNHGQESQAAGGSKQALSIVVIGNQDAGKSTATGHLIWKAGELDAATVKQFEEAASAATHGGGNVTLPASAPRQSFQYSWLMDKIKAQREGGAAVDVRPDAARFASAKYSVTVMDVPGHRDFVLNMITGTSRADLAILFVSADPEEFARGMDSIAPISPLKSSSDEEPPVSVGEEDPQAGGRGQTREHAMLAFTLGLKQLIVAVNKMDSVGYDQERFNAIVHETSIMLKKIGYNVKTVPFVPVSGSTGENLIDVSPKMSWFSGWRRDSKTGEKTGMTLLQAIDATDPPRKLVDRPLRITVQDVYKINNLGTVPVGRVEAGTLRAGMRVRFAPGGVEGVVKSVDAHGNAHAAPEAADAVPGDNVGFAVEGLSLRDVMRGHVASAADPAADPVLETLAFTAQLVVMGPPPSGGGVIMPGYTPVIDIHTAHVPVKVAEMLAKVDRRNGHVIEENPRSLKHGDAAVVRLVPLKPLCVEAFSEYPALGRFALRDQRHTVAVGVIKSVEKKGDDGHTVICPRKK